MNRKAYRHYVLVTLTLVCTLNYTDGGLMTLLLQPIKEDLQLSDTQLGLLTGIAFGFFYATLGLPIGRWADRGNRVTIASVAIALWGATMMACFFVTNFVQLMMARIVAGVGESGCLPPTYSLVGDYFPAPAARTRAMTVYVLANPLAALLSFVLGGWLSERYSWRVAFFVMGIPAVLIAAIVKMTIGEPRARPVDMLPQQRRMPSIGNVFGALWHQPSARHLGIALVLLFTIGQGLGPWYAAFLMRSHGMGIAELGVWLGLIFGISGVVGIALGGYAAASWLAQDERRQMRLSAITVALLVPCYVLFLFLPKKHDCLIALIVLLIVFGIYMGPTFALMQRLVTDEMRATTLAVVLLFANLIGMGIGPQIVGILSDALVPEFGRDSLRYAMLSMSLVALWSAYHFWQVSRTVTEDLVRVARRNQADGGNRDVVSEHSPLRHA